MTQKKRPFIVLLLILSLAFLGWFFWNKSQKNLPDNIKASGTIQTTEIQLGSLVGGRILTVHAQEGDSVRNGQVLVTLNPYQLTDEKLALTAQLKQAEAQLTELYNGPRLQEISNARAQYQAAKAQASLQQAGARTEDIALAQANLQQVQVNLQNDEANYQRFQQLHQRHVISQQEFETVKTTYQSTVQKLNAAKQKLLLLQNGNRPQDIAVAVQQAKARQAQLALLQAGSRPEAIAQQQARISAIKAQLQQLAKTLAETEIKASCSCQINSLDWKPGQIIAAKQTVASLFNLHDLWIRVYVPDERFGQIKAGDTVQVKVDAFPGQLFPGKVIQLASRAEFTPRNIQTEEGRRIQVFGIKIALDNTSSRLRPGMPADVIFNIDESTR